MKIGLMLGGGGALGSYQVGVIKALMEENLFNDIKVMSGSSIGAINIVMVMSQLTISEIENLWLNINNEIIYKSGLPHFKNDDKSLVNVGPLYELLTSDLKAETVKKSSITGYATLTEVKTKKVRDQVNYFRGKKKVICLNHANNPFVVAKGSASVPMLFGSTKIGNHFYVDGGFIDNNPIEPLVEAGCDLILAVPLATAFKTKKFRKEKIAIIDFKNNKSFYKLNTINLIKSLDFNKKLIERLRIEGYEYAKEMISILRKLHIIVDNQFKIDINEFKYYNLEKLEGELNDVNGTV